MDVPSNYQKCWKAFFIQFEEDWDLYTKEELKAIFSMWRAAKAAKKAEENIPQLPQNPDPFFI